MLARTKNLHGLYAGRVISFVSQILIGLFLPIFLYELFGNQAIPVIITFLLLHILYGTLVPAGALLLNAIGFRTGLILGSVFSAVSIVGLYVLDQYAQSDTLILFVGLTFFALLLRALFYWVPFHSEFAKLTDRKKRGVQVGILYGMLTVVSAIIPIFGGYVISTFGYHVLFAVATVVALAAIIPFASIAKSDSHYSWGYRETFRQYFKKENRSLVAISMMAGAENVIGAVVWPLFIFLLLDGDYLKVGIISSFIIAGTALFQLFLGRLLDYMSKTSVLRLGSLLSAVGWVIKFFIATAFQVFVVGVYHNVAKSFMQTSYNAFFYEVAADEGHYVDEYTVIREIGIQYGKAIALSVVICILLFFDIQWAFFVGVVSALLMSFVLTRRAELELSRADGPC